MHNIWTILQIVIKDYIYLIRHRIENLKCFSIADNVYSKRRIGRETRIGEKNDNWQFINLARKHLIQCSRVVVYLLLQTMFFCLISKNNLCKMSSTIRRKKVQEHSETVLVSVYLFYYGKIKLHVACHTDLVSQQENGDSDFLDPKKRLQPRWSSTGHNKLLAPKFFRDPCRQSLGNRPDMFKWFEAQERQEERFKDVSGFCHF